MVDEAWARRNTGKVEHQGKRTVYHVPMGRDIGTGGEQTLRIVVEKKPNGTYEVITAFPE